MIFPEKVALGKDLKVIFETFWFFVNRVFLSVDVLVEGGCDDDMLVARELSIGVLSLKLVIKLLIKLSNKFYSTTLSINLIFNALPQNSRPQVGIYLSLICIYLLFTFYSSSI